VAGLDVHLDARVAAAQRARVEARERLPAREDEVEPLVGAALVSEGLEEPLGRGLDLGAASERQESVRALEQGGLP